MAKNTNVAKTAKTSRKASKSAKPVETFESVDSVVTATVEAVAIELGVSTLPAPTGEIEVKATVQPNEATVGAVSVAPTVAKRSYLSANAIIVLSAVRELGAVLSADEYASAVPFSGRELSLPSSVPDSRFAFIREVEAKSPLPVKAVGHVLYEARKYGGYGAEGADTLLIRRKIGGSEYFALTPIGAAKLPARTE